MGTPPKWEALNPNFEILNESGQLRNPPVSPYLNESGTSLEKGESERPGRGALAPTVLGTACCAPTGLALRQAQGERIGEPFLIDNSSK